MENNLRIMDLPECERPIERLFRYGEETLSNTELLSIILRSGTRNENVLVLSTKIITTFGGLNGLMNCSSKELMELKGVGKTKAAQIIALAELSKRFKAYKSGDEYKICKPKDAADYIMEEMRFLKQEVLKVILLNTKNVVIKVKNVSLGSLNSSIVHPREVFCDAIKSSSASIIICHNHPSGDPTPSGEDINITHRLKECGKLLGIELLDHIIIGDEKYISLKEKGIL